MAETLVNRAIPLNAQGREMEKKKKTTKNTQPHAPRKKSEVKQFSWETNYVAGIILANCGLQNLSWEFIMANCCISFPLLHLFVGVDSTQKCSFSLRLFVQESTDEMPGQALSEWTCHAARRLACHVRIHSRQSLSFSTQWTVLWHKPCFVRTWETMWSPLRSRITSGLKILWGIWKQVVYINKAILSILKYYFLLSASD